MLTLDTCFVDWMLVAKSVQQAQPQYMAHLCVYISFKSHKSNPLLILTYQLTFINTHNGIIYTRMMWKQRLLNIGDNNSYIQIIEINKHSQKLLLFLMTLNHHSSHQCNFCWYQKTFTSDKQHQITLLCSTYQFRYWKTNKSVKLHFSIIQKNWP